ncbi:hypothetical protein TPHA_0G02010 [Tetrapisispora phaffii CBS 4417]|uniref:Uncharacterized protein n=1 Tax=Tetrapisispora phaffii (strain ATCC 24235 / CBS 4417 / NBRC 1672 / NRRL Y-8282 / UCD 70-5) TaxID=1071381 RepID=G8BVV9_TETPH|nr:hypothetical protein TPHA_0G02010 [Tetrapisispora phaffii CBS 4417]CCE64037.1 hypothetical protein TPHA_0G02010 [Tetrapisispora phaffii CBS 4417]
MISHTNTKTSERHSKSFNSIKKPAKLNDKNSDIVGLNNLFTGSITSNKFTSVKEFDSIKRDQANGVQVKESQEKGTNNSNNKHKDILITSSSKSLSPVLTSRSNVTVEKSTLAKDPEGNSKFSRDAQAKGNHLYQNNSISLLSNPMATQPLEPIHEETTDSYQQLKTILDSSPNKLTENDVQDMLLSYTFASGSPDEKLLSFQKSQQAKYEEQQNKKNADPKNKMKSKFANIIFAIIAFIKNIQDILYQYLCIIIFNISVKFPLVVGILRYVLIH